MSNLEYEVGIFLCGIGAGVSLSLLVCMLRQRFIAWVSPEQEKP